MLTGWDIVYIFEYSIHLILSLIVYENCLSTIFFWKIYVVLRVLKSNPSILFLCCYNDGHILKNLNKRQPMLFYTKKWFPG